MNEIQIGVDAWIIRDGNYSDFKIGDHCKFALSFSANEFQKGQEGVREFKRVKGCIFHINAVVEFTSPEFWIVDFGYKAYKEGLPPEGIRVGEWIDAEIYLGIDPFYYIESFYSAEGSPTIFYDWEIKRIEIETTPFIEFAPKCFKRDITREGYKDIIETKSANDDEASDHYVLHCKIE